MLDFLMVSWRKNAKRIEIYPKFVLCKSNDLMIRGGDFYAIWCEERGLWSTDEHDALQMIDKELDSYYREHRDQFEETVKVLHMWDAETGMIDSWHKYCQKQTRDSFHMLDEKLIFCNSETNKKDYASKKLTYALEQGDISAYDKLLSTLYSEEERRKIEWAIGSVVCGDSKKLQKFVVLYGAGGTGKSTVLNIIQLLFDGYWSVFDARALGSSNNSFALESFKTNPLVAIQHDGDLSKIEDNTRLNSLVSHEIMTVNEKFKSAYASRFNCFLFMGTNKPVKITDAKSGLIRRLIDVSPTGERVALKEYNRLVHQINFELGAIAYHCQQVYLENIGRYDNYVPMVMLGASNDFYNFVGESYFVFKKEDGTTLKVAWEMYKTYCDDAKVPYPLPQRAFKEELKNYFREYKERFTLEDGTRVRNYYDGFRIDKFEEQITTPEKEEPVQSFLIFEKRISVFNEEYADYPAQYANAKETPSLSWKNVTTKLSDIDTSRLHYVKPPENHVVVDFDIVDESGNKNLEKNIKEASKWPPTYAELSKSGSGIHLHYTYMGDPTMLSRVYDDRIEIKTFPGDSSLRRKLTKNNGFPIAKISSGLPLKGEKVVSFETLKNEKAIRTLIKKNLNKEIHGNTTQSINFINQILQDAYSSGINYDVSDLLMPVFAFAANSTHQAGYCVNLVGHMPFKSDEASAPDKNDEAPIVFFDTETVPNLFLVEWKLEGFGKPILKMINPKPTEVEELLKYRLIGFNCRRYDNHLLYGAMLGYTNEQLFALSQSIIKGIPGCFFREAYNISYTDIYDFTSEKKSLKKWEIELGIHHRELGFPWDEPIPEEKWPLVIEYCANDVIATEAVFNARKEDFVARQILAELAGMTVNDTTNTLATRIIFGTEKHPKLIYTDLATGAQY